MATDPAVISTVVLIAVTLSFPCFIYGAWYIIEQDPVTWDDLMYHLTFIGLGLALTTVPLIGWMIPRLPMQMNGVAAVHAYLGLQAYALLAFAGTGIVRIFRAKRRYDLYHDYDHEVILEEIGEENFAHWRRRLRIGVFGYILFWLLAYIVGVSRFLLRYVL